MIVGLAAGGAAILAVLGAGLLAVRRKRRVAQGGREAANEAMGPGAARQQRLDAAISAEVHMISGCQDKQTSADANITNLACPTQPGVRAGPALPRESPRAAATALPNRRPTVSDSRVAERSLLQVLYKDHVGAPQDDAGDNTSWVDVLRDMRTNLAAKGYDQIPQLSSSRMVDVNEPFQMVNPSGTRRAVLIGINYAGTSGELTVSVPRKRSRKANIADALTCGQSLHLCPRLTHAMALSVLTSRGATTT